MSISKNRASIVSLILARGGSKEIPRKNLIEINSKPFISYVIEAAKASKSDQVWVSTDDEEIAHVSIDCGARVLHRPLAISLDNSKSEEALLHFSDNVDYDFLVFIQATSPLLSPGYINKGIELVLSGQFDSVFSVTPEHWIPRWNVDLTPDKWDPAARPRRQDMPKRYVENGAFYITSRECLLNSKCRYSGRLGIVEMPLESSFQLDSLDDLSLLEKLLSV